MYITPPDSPLSGTSFIESAENPTPIELVKTADFNGREASLDAYQKASLKRQDFSAAKGQRAWLNCGDQFKVLVGWDGLDDLATLGGLPLLLTEGDYYLESPVSDLQLIGWGMGSYQFNRYKSASRAPARLVMPDGADSKRVINTTRSVALCRDLINTPAQDMAPSHLEAESRDMAAQFGANISVTVGDELLAAGCGAIHAVGRAADDAPRLIDLTWGAENAPKITIVGKGVTFDSGGLDMKPGSAMRMMKKDMGGAANAIGLAYLIMAEQLPVRLRLLVPTAENAISGNAFRPGDILHTHKGLTVEIDNTDAEGRLLLCDALSIATEDKPDAIFDYATLTGSARSAVGAEVSAMFCNSDALADSISRSGRDTDDPVWRMPLHGDYNHMLNSKVADMVNCAPSPYAGAITAALFLERFVDDMPWMHFDINAFNTRSRPGHPEGGEAMALRAVFDYLRRTYA